MTSRRSRRSKHFHRLYPIFDVGGEAVVDLLHFAFSAFERSKVLPVPAAHLSIRFDLFVDPWLLEFGAPPSAPMHGSFEALAEALHWL